MAKEEAKRSRPASLPTACESLPPAARRRVLATLAPLILPAPPGVYFMVAVHVFRWSL